MGIAIKLTCPNCKLESGALYIGKGSDIGQCYGVAWCPQCKEFTTPLVPDGLFKETVTNDNCNLATIYLLDDRSIACPPDYLSTKHRICCLNCCQEVPIFDLENKNCPLCGYPMEEEIIGLWIN